MKHRVRMILTILGSLAALSVFMVAFQFMQSSGVATGQSVPATGGLKMTVTGVNINSSNIPEVSFTLADAKGSPLKIADLDANAIRFDIVVQKVNADTGATYWETYITTPVTGTNFTLYGKAMTPAVANVKRPTTDSGGVFTDKGGGAYVYTFKTAMPASYSKTATHRVAGQSSRDARAAISNVVFDFVPAGGTPTAREIVTTAACNGCHDPLRLHGARVEVGYCVTCHLPQNIDTQSGNNLDLGVMVHQIHSGAKLPSVVAGSPYFIASQSHDYSGVLFPQDARNCTTCHAGKQGDAWKNNPSALACGSCHNNVNFQTGANHAAGAQSDKACKLCHPADGAEFDISVAGAHAIPDKAKQLRGVNVTIVSVSNAKPGQSPTVVYNIKDNAGQTIKPSEMTSLSLVLGGPTSDYTNYVSEAAAAGSTASADGNYSYTFTAKVPAGATGTYAVGVQGVLNQTLKKYTGENITARNIAINKVAYAAVTDSVAQPRKKIVDINKCNVCHDQLYLHGGGRNAAEYCLLCHNPNNTDATKRASVNGPTPPTSVSFGPMIHKIHTGEEQNDPLIIYGGGAGNVRPVDLSEVLYPADRRSCDKCHITGSEWLLYARQTAQPVVVKVGDKVVSSTPPISAVCTGCHDSIPAKTHAAAQTVNGSESCVVCHNEGRDFAVSAVHAH